MNWLRIVGWKLGLWRLVVLENYQGELRLRRLRPALHPRYIGMAEWMGYHIRPVYLKPDGSLDNGAYVERWYEYPIHDAEAEEIKALERMVSR